MIGQLFGAHCSPFEQCAWCLTMQDKQINAWRYDHGMAGGMPAVTIRERTAAGIEYDHGNALIEFESRKKHGLIS